MSRVRPLLPEVREGLRAEIPGPDGEPLIRLELRSERRPEGDGERLALSLRLRTRVGATLQSLGRAGPPQNALPPPRGVAQAVVRRVQQGAVGALRRLAQQRSLQALADRLAGYELNSFVEIQASTASLHQGSRALVPQDGPLAALGIRPDASPAAPPLQLWTGADARGEARAAFLRLDREQLPEPLRRALGATPLALSATVVQTAEHVRPRP